MTGEVKASETTEERGELATELESSDVARRLAAIEAIAAAPTRAIGDAALEALVACVGAERKIVQRRAIDALAAIAESGGGDSRVRTSLERAMTGDNRRARFGAAYALARLGNNDVPIGALDALCEALGDDDGDIRWAACVLIVQLGKQYRDEIRARMIALGATGNPNARKMALYCMRDLGFAGADVLALLENSARDANIHIRLAALAVLAKLDDRSGAAAAIALKSLEHDTDAGVRRAAAVAMGQAVAIDSRTIPALEIAAASENDPALVRAAKSALDRLEKR